MSAAGTYWVAAAILVTAALFGQIGQAGLMVRGAELLEPAFS